MVRVADRRDYVISNIDNPIPALSGPVQLTVTLDTNYPCMWTGWYLGSIYSSTPSGGGLVQVQATDLSFQLFDSNRDMLFSNFLAADAVQYAVTSSNVSTGNNRNEIVPMNPEQYQPAGGSFLVEATNLNATGNLFFELVLVTYKLKDDCLRTKAPDKHGVGRNVLRVGRIG